MAAPVGKGRALGRPLASVLNVTPREHVRLEHRIYISSSRYGILQSWTLKTRVKPPEQHRPGLHWPGPVFQPRSGSDLEILLKFGEVQISQGSLVPGEG